MHLKTTFPIAELTAIFEKHVNITIYDSSQIEEIANIDPLGLHEIGANVWMHYIESGAKVKPQKLASYFQQQDPYLYKAIEKIIKRKAIQEIVLVNAEIEDPSLTFRRCGKALLARTYPNNLHISYVEFNNPYKPIEATDKKFTHHKYKSLGLFSQLLQNLTMFAKANRIRKITLSASTNEQYQYFQQHGFTLEKNAFASAALERGTTIPMELLIN